MTFKKPFLTATAIAAVLSTSLALADNSHPAGTTVTVVNNTQHPIAALTDEGGSSTAKQVLVYPAKTANVVLTNFSFAFAHMTDDGKNILTPPLFQEVFFLNPTMQPNPDHPDLFKINVNHNIGNNSIKGLLDSADAAAKKVGKTCDGKYKWTVSNWDVVNENVSIVASCAASTPGELPVPPVANKSETMVNCDKSPVTISGPSVDKQGHLLPIKLAAYSTAGDTANMHNVDQREGDAGDKFIWGANANEGADNVAGIGKLSTGTYSFIKNKEVYPDKLYPANTKLSAQQINTVCHTL